MDFNAARRAVPKFAALLLFVSALAAYSTASAQSDRPGDVNSDGVVDATDLALLTKYIFAGGPPPIPLANGNIDKCLGADVSDAVILAAFVYGHIPLPDPDTVNCAFSPDQDPGIRDTCRYEPTSSTWEITNPSDDLFSVGLYGWTDSPDIQGASLGFIMRTSTGGGYGHDDSLIVVDTFVFSPDVSSVPIKLFSRSLLDESIDPGANNVGFNGYLLGLVGFFGPVLIPNYPTHIGDLTLRILDPANLPMEFDITLDSIFFPPAGVFKWSPAAGEGYPPEFLSGTIHVINHLGLPEQPTIGLDPTSFLFTASEGEANPPNQMMNILNTGEGTLNWTASNNSSWLTLDPYSGTGDAVLTLTVDITGLSAGEFYDTILVSDPNATNSPQYAPVYLIIDANQAPVLEPIGPQLVEEGSNLTFEVYAWDPDSTIPALLAEDLPMNSAFVDDGDGTGVFTFDPDYTQAGVYTVLFIATDGMLSDSEYVEITVPEVNRAPVLEPIGDWTVEEGDTLLFLVTAYDPDGTTPSLTVDWIPPNAFFTDNGNGTGDFYFEPDYSQAGAYEILFIASDGMLEDSQMVVITVIDVSLQPTIALDPDYFEFYAQEGGANPPDQYMEILNVGAGVLDWFASNSSTWLSLDPFSGVGDTVVRLSVDISGLTPGLYGDTILVLDTSATNSPQYAVVYLFIDEADPVLMVEPGYFSFYGVENGPDPSPDSMLIWNAGGGILEWEIYHTSSWLSIDPSWGTGPATVLLMPSIAGLPPGTYGDTVIVSDTSALNSPQYVAVYLTISPGLECEITAHPADEVCENDTVIFCATPGMLSYVWDGPGLVVDDQQCVPVGYGLAPGVYTYTVTITDSSGFESTCSRDLTIFETPICEIAGPDEVCEGFVTELCATPGMVIYDWSGPGLIGPDQECVVVVGDSLPAGTYTYTVTIVDVNGCQSTCSFDLTVLENPICEITGVNQICDGSDAEWCGPDAPAGMTYVYDWAGPGGFVAATRCVTVGQGLGPGIYTYVLTVTDQYGCQSTCFMDLIIFEPPSCEIEAFPGDMIIQGDSAVFCATPGMAEYYWFGPGVDSVYEQCATVGIGLPPGVYTYGVTIVDSNGCVSECSRELTVLEPEPIIQLEPDYFFFIMDEGGPNPASQGLMITNVGGGILEWAMGETADWLYPSDSIGTAPSMVALSVAGGGLPAGFYSDTVLVYGNAVNSPVYFVVSLEVNPVEPIIQLEPDYFFFTMDEGGPNPASQGLMITNVGGGILEWAMGETADWLYPSDTVGTAPAMVALSVSGSGLPAGLYRDTVLVFGNAPNSPQYSVVDLEIRPSEAVIQLEPDYFFFTMDDGGPNPPGQTLAIANIGSGTLNWEIGETESWLYASDSAGTAPSAVTLNVDGLSLAPGLYRDTVFVFGNASNSPQYSVVDLEIRPSEAVIQLEPTYFFFTMDDGGPNPPGQTLTVANIGSGTLNWEMGETPSWLYPSDTSGTAPSTVTLSVDGIGLPPGLYGDTVSVSGNAINSPQHFAVFLEIQPGFDCGDATVLIDPDTVYVYEAFAIDPIHYAVYVGDFEACEVLDIDTSTVRLIGAGVPIDPAQLEILDTLPGFEGEVLALTFTAADFFDAYGLLWAWSVQTFTVEGMMVDSIPFEVSGFVTVRGHRVGDVDLSGIIDIDDVVFLAYFMFAAGPPPLVPEVADTDASGSLDIDDIVNIVQYIFNDRNLPCDEDRDGIPDF